MQPSTVIFSPTLNWSFSSHVTGTVKADPTDISEYNGEWECKLTITVEGKDIFCYYLKGTENQIKNIKAGDTITVSGTIKNFNGTVEFDKPRMQ